MLAFAVGAASPILAQTLVAGTDWQSLAPAERQALAPLQHDWATMDSERQQKWLEVARRFPSLPDDERARVQERMNAWSQLSPAERGRARVQFQEAQRWSPQTRSERWEEYQRLDPEARRVLAERWRLEQAARRADALPDEAAGKRNVVEPRPVPLSPREAASPTSVQAPAGATSTLISPRPPLRGPLNTGVPKIAGSEAFVDPITMLPRRGPQAAAVTPVPRAAARRERQR